MEWFTCTSWGAYLDKPIEYVPSKLIFLGGHVSLTRGSAHSEGLIEVVKHLRDCVHCQTSLEPVAKARSVPGPTLPLIVVVHTGHVDHAHAAPADVAPDLVLFVEAVLTRRGGQLVSEHVPRTLAPPQVHHGLAPPPPGAGDGARDAGQARDGDGQGQRPTAPQKSLLRSFLSRLHAFILSLSAKAQLLPTKEWPGQSLPHNSIFHSMHTCVLFQITKVLHEQILGSIILRVSRSTDIH